jgi:hypothetical protein
MVIGLGISSAEQAFHQGQQLNRSKVKEKDVILHRLDVDIVAFRGTTYLHAEEWPLYRSTGRRQDALLDVALI